jgi:hypothetical protein
VDDLLLQIEDWASKEANGGQQIGQTLYHGKTDKARAGIILFRWLAPVPNRLLLSLMHDPTVNDLMLYEYDRVSEQGEPAPPTD